MVRRLLAAFVLSVLFARSALAAQCGGDFSAFIAAMSREAAAGGISRAVIDNALAGVTPDQAVLAFDRTADGTVRRETRRHSVGAAISSAYGTEGTCQLCDPGSTHWGRPDFAKTCRDYRPQPKADTASIVGVSGLTP